MTNLHSMRQFLFPRGPHAAWLFEFDWTLLGRVTVVLPGPHGCPLRRESADGSRVWQRGRRGIFSPEWRKKCEIHVPIPFLKPPFTTISSHLVKGMQPRTTVITQKQYMAVLPNLVMLIKLALVDGQWVTFSFLSFNEMFRALRVFAHVTSQFQWNYHLLNSGNGNLHSVTVHKMTISRIPVASTKHFTIGTWS